LERELEAVSARVRQVVLESPYPLALGSEHLRQAALLYPLSGGKHLRSAMMLWSCAVLGGDPEQALPAAAAVELYHTWTLTHDDIIDRDERRRGGPSVHAAFRERAGEVNMAADAAHYGLSIAVLAGDVQHAWAIELLAGLAERGVDRALVLRLIRELEGPVLRAIIEGETRDLQLSHQPIEAVGEDEIVSMIAQKTGALYAFAAAAGGIIAAGMGEDQPQLVALREFARVAAIAFQLRDDVLGIVGSDAELGKPVGSDLREGKRTTILRHAWIHASARERETLSAAVGRPDADRAAVAAATELLVHLGGTAHTDALATRYLSQATERLDTLPPGRYHDLLRALAVAMVERRR
jgi:geranylgeranyl diphosphate synthase type I